ncbi:MAG: threonylcarbamoyl-AMP synthase [Calothrix sp. SM1_5_4]|nr:threonylcarbamoyl-AMP synthase [Calothrix sp. SM1_5_4]
MSTVTVSEAVALLNREEVVAIPTETVYGLAGRIDSDRALERIFTVKERPFFDPLIVHVHDVSQVDDLCSEWPAVFAELARAFWPGPLTLVAPKKPAVSPLITSGLQTVAVRCPRHPVAREVLLKTGVPLAAPSANRFGKTSPTLASARRIRIRGTRGRRHGGPCEVGVESTVVDLEGETLRILRPGGVSRAEIEKLVSPRRVIRAHSSASPGHLKAHYQPEAPLVITDTNAREGLKERIEAALGRALTEINFINLSMAPEFAARKLYEEFRRLSADTKSAIVAERDPSHAEPAWEAVWDRIERAAALDLRNLK